MVTNKKCMEQKSIYTYETSISAFQFKSFELSQIKVRFSGKKSEGIRTIFFI